MLTVDHHSSPESWGRQVEASGTYLGDTLGTVGCVEGPQDTPFGVALSVKPRLAAAVERCDLISTDPLVTREGWTPAWGAEPKVTDALVDQLKDAGLGVEIQTVERSKDDDDTVDYASFPEGSLLDVSPALGSVIAVGGTVTVTVSRSLDQSR